MTKKEAEKILKYKDLIIEMWNVKAWLIPVIIGVKGTISKSLRQYLSNIPGKHEIKELQKNSRMVTYKYKTHFTGEITLHVAQIVNTEQLQHYIP